jgi:hypothetical protein
LVRASNPSEPAYVTQVDGPPRAGRFRAENERALSLS